MTYRIRQMWESYREAVIPAGATPGQVRECRLAFYAGAVSLWAEIMSTLGPGQEATEGDMLMMAEIEIELQEFSEQARNGVV